jgi:transcriptional regulator of NAD metabolism
MGPEERRKSILDALVSSAEPVTGQDLALKLKVSRQVIVQDIALLRAHGQDVVATPRGYVLAAKASRARVQAIVACRHGRDNVREELLSIVELGGEVIDVIVEHPLYGQMTGLLMLKSERDVSDFMKRVEDTSASLLSALTQGVHLHTIRAHDRTALRRIIDRLKSSGYLLDERS